MSAEFSYEPAVLVLGDGRSFFGRSIGAAGEILGQLHFDTGLTGYLETLTAPENSGALVAFTTPHIGNAGISDTDAKPTVAGAIMRDPSRIASHWGAAEALVPYLQTNGVIAISHVDTRALIRHAGANYRADAAPVTAGIFTGERAEVGVSELIETVKNYTQQKGR